MYTQLIHLLSLLPVKDKYFVIIMDSFLQFSIKKHVVGTQ